MNTAPHRPRVVWVVDDSALDAEHARRALDAEYDVRVFGDGAATLEHLSDYPAPDVLVLDWVMEGVSGIDVCHYIRSAKSPAPQLPILLLTGRQEAKQVVEGLAAGANDYLSKPYAPEELLARVRALVRSRELIERVERAEENVRRLLATAPDALLAVDAAGVVTFVNDEAERTFNRPAAALVGKRLDQILPTLDLSPLVGGRRRLALPDVIVGEQVYSPIVRVLPSDFATSTSIALHNVTERRQVEARRLDFYSVIAHDLRSPLSALLLRAELLLRGARGPLPAPAIADLRRMEGAVKSMVALINDFLDLARLEGSGYRLERTPVDLAALVRDMADEMQPLLSESQLSLRVLVNGDDAQVPGDRRRLAQVLSNLFSNAIKFTPPGGAITARVDAEADFVSVRVTDTGRGIPKDKLPDLFQRYARAIDPDHPIAGTGLGLMIVREIVEAHGGEVGAESEAGQGSTFRFRVPRTLAPTLSAASAAAEVLVVDDDQDVREALRFVLEAEGFSVAEAPNGRAALDVLASRRPLALVLDLNMPVMTGWEVVARLRAAPELRALPVCVLSGVSRDAPAGVDRVLQKPLRVDELLAFLHEVVTPARAAR